VAVVEPDGRVSAFLERPSEAERRGVESAWAFSGLCVCSPGVIEAIPREGASDLPRDVFPRLVAEGRLFAQPLAGYRIAVDSPERLESLRNAVAAGRLGAQPT
jgi:mannose-1-phosphate guanylyltransferase/phosphomannomutase